MMWGGALVAGRLIQYIRIIVLPPASQDREAGADGSQGRAGNDAVVLP